ncbi:hypothetical protein L0668_09245 [Paraglaciecola aquimarina]|uniref:Uncharacterized protein n=1 Tax=Paraglaciecola algarum TaxID=3050085 RepID=A0ABS9D6H4_9ALTE|nr:hypothetical protein [Paraglaciecola sp. G1-23]MCF2948289.1 hypothetical protein [Paraglaciecola sp. G1-23]
MIYNIIKNSLLSVSVALATVFVANAAPEQNCFYETYEVEVYVVECEYEANLEYFGIPNYNNYPTGTVGCPAQYQRQVSLEKDKTITKVLTAEGSAPSCGTRWMSHDWNGTTNVNGYACDYWWREGKNVNGYVEESGTRLEPRTRWVCENI